jgi:hypothetical protein
MRLRKHIKSKKTSYVDSIVEASLFIYGIYYSSEKNSMNTVRYVCIACLYLYITAIPITPYETPILHLAYVSPSLHKSATPELHNTARMHLQAT